jgi:hypothetical protein
VNKLFFLIFLSVGASASECVCTFKQIALSENVQSLVYKRDAWQEIAWKLSVNKAFENQSTCLKKIGHAYDFEHKRAVCVQHVGGSQYQLVCYEESGTFAHQIPLKKPLNIGITNNIVFYLDGEKEISLIEFSVKNNQWDVQKLNPIFDESSKNTLTSFTNLPLPDAVRCCPGPNGEIYLTHDEKEFYLLSIKEKPKAPELIKPAIDPNVNNQISEKPNKKSPIFLILKFGGVGLVLLGIIFLICRNYELKWSGYN